MRNFAKAISSILIISGLMIATNSFAVKYIVSVGNFFFSPPSINANVGDTIRWNWSSGFHTTTATAPNIPSGAATWNAPIQNAGQFFEYKITVAGTYNYFCAVHGAALMSGSFTATSPPPPLTANASATPASIASGQTSQLDVSATGGTGVYTYSWTSVPSGFTSTLKNPVVSPTVTTTYTCHVVSGAQNTNAPVTVTVGPPEFLTLQNINVQSGQTFCYDATQTITVGGDDQHPFTVGNGGNVTMIAGQNIVYLPGTAAMSGSYMHGYITTTGAYCNTLPPPTIAGTGDVTSHAVSGNQLFSIFPNPNPGSFMVKLNNDLLNMPVTMDIYNTFGKTVVTKTFTGSDLNNVSITSQPGGIYYIRIISGKTSETLKMIKQ